MFLLCRSNGPINQEKLAHSFVVEPIVHGGRIKKIHNYKNYKFSTID